MKCPSCQHENRSGAKFCGACAGPLIEKLTCAACGNVNPPHQKFCDECGAALTGTQPQNVSDRPGDATSAIPRTPRDYAPAHLAERLRAEQAAFEARGAAGGERKTITALFADLKGSTALIEGLDPEEVRALIDPRDSGAAKASPPKHERCWRRSMTGSPKASRPRT